MKSMFLTLILTMASATSFASVFNKECKLTERSLAYVNTAKLFQTEESVLVYLSWYNEPMDTYVFNAKTQSGYTNGIATLTIQGDRFEIYSPSKYGRDGVHLVGECR